MAVVFPSEQVPVVEGPQQDAEYRWSWTLVPAPEGVFLAYEKVQERRRIEILIVRWVCTKEPGDVLDISVSRWTEAPAGFVRSQAALTITNDRTRPQLCRYEETWQKKDEEWTRV